MPRQKGQQRKQSNNALVVCQRHFNSCDLVLVYFSNSHCDVTIQTSLSRLKVTNPKYNADGDAILLSYCNVHVDVISQSYCNADVDAILQS
jgi:hypothetical protein